MGGDTHLGAQAQAFGDEPFHREVVGELEVVRLVDGVQRSVPQRVTYSGGCVEAEEGLHQVAFLVVRVVVGLHIDIVLERAVFALLGFVGGDAGVVAEDEVLHRVEQGDVARQGVTLRAFHGTGNIVVSH